MRNAFDQLEQELLPEVGKAVALAIYSPQGRVLVIKRPDDEEWEPGKYSPPTGHIEKHDIQFLLEGADVLSPSKEQLYVIAGAREFREEVRREPSHIPSLRYIGHYHDDQTSYEVIVLTGMLVPSGSHIRTSFRKPQVYPSEETASVKWLTSTGIRRLANQGRLVGFRTYEMAFNDDTTQRTVQGYMHAT